MVAQLRYLRILQQCCFKLILHALPQILAIGMWMLPSDFEISLKTFRIVTCIAFEYIAKDYQGLAGSGIKYWRATFSMVLCGAIFDHGLPVY